MCALSLCFPHSLYLSLTFTISISIILSHTLPFSLSLSLSLSQSSVTICTVGFGDLSPTTDGGRIFTIFFALIGCTLSVKGFSEVVRFPIVLKLKQNEMNVSSKLIKLNDLLMLMLPFILIFILFDHFSKIRRNENFFVILA